MTRNQFISELKKNLKGYIPKEEIDSYVEYYEEYFLSKQKEGLSEQEAVNQLDEPRLIAKTIIDINGNDYSRKRAEDDASEYEGFSNYKAERTKFEKLKLNILDLVIRFIFDRENLSNKERIMIVPLLFVAALLIVAVIALIFMILRPIIHIFMIILLVGLIMALITSLFK